MQNECENRITVNANCEAELNSFLEAVGGPGGPFDFAAIRPVPEVLPHICMGSRIVDGKAVRFWYADTASDGSAQITRCLEQQEWEEFAKTGFQSRPAWLHRNWGCLSNALHMSEYIDDAYACFEFSTDSTPPKGIVQNIRSRFPNLDITAYYMAHYRQEGGYY